MSTEQDLDKQQIPSVNDNRLSSTPEAGWSPLFLPMDRSFEAKYLEHCLNKDKKHTIKENIYLFLEYPSGCFGFFYHTLV